MILEILKGGEHCACELLEQLEISQSTLSHHMKILNDSKVVISRRKEKWTYYTLSDEGITNAMRLLSEYIISEDKALAREVSDICK